MRVLDTDILIDIQRGYEPARAWFASLSELPYVPGLVDMELLQDTKNKQQVHEVERIVAPLHIVRPTAIDCQRALDDFKRLHLSHRLGLLDALISATAIGLGAALVTFNVKHYSSVSDLVTEQPYVR